MSSKTQNLTAKPPVAVVMGHVDSGKTSLLDAIRRTQVAAKESGGITQHIGAYQIERKGKKITFIDTPGHEAFSAMRSRGARVADVAVLVVDAVKGVEPQTKEAIQHIKKAGIPLIVSLNKIDRPEANSQKAKGELAKEDILVESMGGKVPAVETSAAAGKERGIEEVLEMILLVSEMENLVADISQPAEGVVIESHSDSRKGIKITAIITQGILEPGSFIGTPSAVGKVKSLEDFQGKQIKKALPADPVSVFGFESLPRIGENFKVFASAEEALTQFAVSEKRKTSFDPKQISPDQKVLNLILKADCQGSIEAIVGILEEIPQEKVVLQILGAQAGDINESDIRSAKSNRAVIFGFRVKPNPSAKVISERDRIRIMNFEIIYDLVEGVRKLMEAKVSPEISRVEAGRARIPAIFLTEKNRQVLGGRVLSGQIEEGNQVEVQRGEEVVGRGKIINLQRNKKEAPLVKKGDECGLLYEGDVKVEKEDVLIAFKEERTRGEL